MLVLGMIGKEGGRLASEIFILDKLILELAVKVIILGIVKYIEDKCSFAAPTCPMRSARFWQ
jgi:hypothetical protein